MEAKTGNLGTEGRMKKERPPHPAHRFPVWRVVSIGMLGYLLWTSQAPGYVPALPIPAKTGSLILAGCLGVELYRFIQELLKGVV